MWIRFTRSFWGATLYIRAGMSFFDKRSQEHEIRAEKWPGIVLWNHLEPSVLIHKPLHACFKPYIFSFCSWLLLSNSDDIRSKQGCEIGLCVVLLALALKKVFKKHSVPFMIIAVALPPHHVFLHISELMPQNAKCTHTYSWLAESL